MSCYSVTPLLSNCFLSRQTTWFDNNKKNSKATLENVFERERGRLFEMTTAQLDDEKSREITRLCCLSFRVLVNYYAVCTTDHYVKFTVPFTTWTVSFISTLRARIPFALPLPCPAVPTGLTAISNCRVSRMMNCWALSVLTIVVSTVALGDFDNSLHRRYTRKLLLHFPSVLSYKIEINISISWQISRWKCTEGKKTR